MLPDAIFGQNWPKTDKIIYIFISSSHSGYPRVPEVEGEPNRLDLKGSWCNHEVLVVVEVKNYSKIGIFVANLAAF